MATVFENVHLSTVTEKGDIKVRHESPIKIKVVLEKKKTLLSVSNGTEHIEVLDVSEECNMMKMGAKMLAVASSSSPSYLLRFQTPNDCQAFHEKLKQTIASQKSVFDKRTDDASAEQYFQFYSYLSQQQNMMQDYIRTSTYQRAMLDNTVDFQDKVVLDVGAGSGILSFFAIQAGAKKVYAIEASSMAAHCKTLVKQNNLEDRVIVVAGKVEDVDIPEQVDVIISEPMGYMLYNERMLESFLHAKKWLRPGGKVFPTQGDLHIAPFTDDSLYMEQFSKANFWYQPSFHGVDLASLREAAVKEYFIQPIVDTFDIQICMARPHKYSVDFQTAQETDLHSIEVPVSYMILKSGTVHGLAFWFDVAFFGSQTTVWLSTAPTQPLTHWYQVRCLLQKPIFVKQGQALVGKVHLRSNNRQSYDVDIELYVPGTNIKSKNTLDLKNPFFRYTGQQPQPPPGTDETSPSDNYWNQQDASAVAVEQQVHSNSYGVNTLLNGGMGDAQIVQVQQGHVLQNNLIPLANVAPINPGSIPAATVVTPNSAAQINLQTRTSVGGGISPNLIQQAAAVMTSSVHSAGSGYPISSQFMIGDYMLPGNMMIPSHGLVNPNFKAGNGV